MSVVIPAWNCREQVERAIGHLRQQTYPAASFEILVVDDGSEDGTGAAAERLGARVVRHERNRGRVAARETGARAALHETLVFLDARVVPEREVLANAARIGHLPLMGVGASDKHRSLIDRIFYCIRRRVYQPYEPQFRWGKELWLRPGEFDGRPKGLGLFIINRQTFIECALEDKSQDVNDDTQLLWNIVSRGHAILRHTDLVFTYEHRQRWPDLLRHTFFRGPKFLDYYLVPGGPHFKKYLGAWGLVGLLMVLISLRPDTLLWLLPLVVAAYAGGCLWLSEDAGDFLACFFLFPPIAVAFSAGILWAQVARLSGLRGRLIRH